MIYTTPATPATPAETTIAPPAESTRVDRAAAFLVLKVPADATIYLANQKMSLTGTERKFRIPIADAGKEYSYPVRVEVVRDGKTLVSRSEQKVRGGQQFELAVAESADDGSLVVLARR